MRPSGEVAQCILRAAADLAVVQGGVLRGATLQELAARSQVGLTTARWTVRNLKRAGALRQVAERRVDYRNKPVAEYAPAKQEEPHTLEEAATNEVERVMTLWAHR